jgi:hypothetical protein
MVSIFNSVSDLINSMVKLNSSWNKVSNIKLNEKSNKLPISCRYFLTILDSHNRTIDYPFVKEPNIDYSMMIEIEQFHNIDLDKNLTIQNISNNIDEFINIVNESNGKIIFVLDICYLLNFIVLTSLFIIKLIYYIYYISIFLNNLKKLIKKVNIYHIFQYCIIIQICGEIISNQLTNLIDLHVFYQQIQIKQICLRYQ